jgi:ParB family chromosome partitioning protein
VDRRPALGKGLSALIPDALPSVGSGSVEVDIDRLSPNAQQPRLQIDEAKLDELVQSIKAKGIIQPILVRPAGTGYRIIAGERRWRAAQRAGLLKVPVVVRDMPEGSDQELLELALIENVQRENLNPLDEAVAYQRLADQFSLTQDQIAAAVGKDRSSVANFMRLLRLPEEVRADLSGGALTMGHARTLLSLPDAAAQRHAAREVISKSLSVRETEALVKKEIGDKRGGDAQQPIKSKKDVHTRAAEDQLRMSLGTPVEIKRKGKGGTISISFTNETELQRLYDYLTAKR